MSSFVCFSICENYCTLSDYAVSVRENEDGKKVFVMDDSAGREREKIRQQFDRMLADIGAEMG